MSPDRRRSLHLQRPRAAHTPLSAGSTVPALSVVIAPADDTPEGLQATVDALLREAPANLEIIVVTGGSGATPPAVTTLTAAADQRVRLLHQPRASAAAARTAGLASATGAYVGFLSPGAEVEPGWMRGMLNAAARSPAIIRGELRLLREGHPPQLQHACAFMAQHTPLHWFGAMESAIYRRDFVEKHDLRFAAECRCDDAVFQVRAVVAALVSGERIALRPRAVCRRRCRSETDPGFTLGRRQVACSLQAYAELHELLVEHARQLPPSGVGAQYGMWLHRLFALTRRAVHPCDAAAANALAQRLVLECPRPEEYEHERVARVYGLPGDGGGGEPP